MKESRETYAGRRTEPELWGLERAALYPTAAAWTCAAMGLTFLHQYMHTSWPVAVGFTTIPATLVTIVSMTLIQGRPRGYFMNWVEENILGARHFTPRRKVPRHPLDDTQL